MPMDLRFYDWHPRALTPVTPHSGGPSGPKAGARTWVSDEPGSQVACKHLFALRGG